MEEVTKAGHQILTCKTNSFRQNNVVFHCINYLLFFMPDLVALVALFAPAATAEALLLLRGGGTGGLRQIN